MRWSLLAVLPILFLGVGCMSKLDAREPARSSINGKGTAVALVGVAQTVKEEPHRDEPEGIPAPTFNPAPQPPALPDERLQTTGPVNDAQEFERAREQSLAYDEGYAETMAQHAQAPMQMPGGYRPDNYRPPTRERRQILAFVRTRGVQRCNGRFCTIDTSERDACAALPARWELMRSTGWEVRKNGGHVHVIDIDELPDVARQWGVTKAPTFVLTVNNTAILRTSKAMTAVQIAQFYSGYEPHPLSQSRDGWRAHLPMAALPQATEVESKALLLPKTQINLERQAVEFITSQESQLNRWLSIAFKAGEISHSGKTVNFSAPPEMRLHMTGGAGSILLDSLKSIEFTANGANLHLSRLGTIPIHVGI